MVEYLYNAIRAVAGQEITIAARIVEDNTTLTSGCGLMLHNKEGEELIAMVNGNYVNGVWEFTIPKEVTKGLRGRYWYCICHNDKILCFQ